MLGALALLSFGGCSLLLRGLCFHLLAHRLFLVVTLARAIVFSGAASSELSFSTRTSGQYGATRSSAACKRRTCSSSAALALSALAAAGPSRAAERCGSAIVRRAAKLHTETWHTEELLGQCPWGFPMK